MSQPITVEKYAVGQSARRVEDPHLLQGLGRYSDDVNVPHQAYAVVVRSPHAHARIRALDAAEARGAPGVLAVLKPGNNLQRLFQLMLVNSGPSGSLRLASCPVGTDSFLDNSQRVLAPPHVG